MPNPGHLLDFYYHEFSWLDGCKTYEYVNDSAVDILLVRGFLIAFNEVGFSG
jgi:hypothetical protein